MLRVVRYNSLMVSWNSSGSKMIQVFPPRKRPGCFHQHDRMTQLDHQINPCVDLCQLFQLRRDNATRVGVRWDFQAEMHLVVGRGLSYSPYPVS